MKIRNKRGFITGLLSAVLAIICIVSDLIYHEQRFLISGLLLILLSAMNFVRAFLQKGIQEELKENADERDIYLTMRSGHLAIQIINYTICASSFISLILYGLFKEPLFIAVAGTLCTVLVLIFITFLGVNIYLERHE